MKAHTITRPLAAVAAILLAVTLTSCTFHHDGLPVGPTFKCPGAIYRYGQSSLIAPPTDGACDNSGPGHFLFSPLAQGRQLYPDQPFKPVGPPNPLKGTYVLQVPSSRKTGTASNIGPDWAFELTLFGRSVDRIWIAFDQRASHAPDWLPMDFKKVGPPLVLQSSESYFGSGSPAHVKYQIWAPKVGFADYIENGTRTLGGNNAPGVVWDGGKVGSQYLVIIRMRPQPDTSTKLNQIGTTSFEVGTTSPNQPIPPLWFESAKTEAMAKWLAQPQNTKYQQAYEDGLVGIEASTSSCSEIKATVSSTSKPLLAPHDGPDPELLGTWVEASQGTIDPSSSTVTVTVSGYSPDTTHVQGAVDFTIQDGNTAIIHNIDLWGHDVVLSDNTKISDITLTQRHAFVAECADGLPHFPQRLCSRYEVPVDPELDLSVGVALKVQDHDLTVLMENSQPLVLDVNLNAMTFTLSGGPLRGTFVINDQPYTADISLSIQGAFTNLAPVADVSETQMVWECGDTGIADVLLSATASTDELDPMDITSYDWYEDRGALTEAHLGSGATLKKSMVFGNHDLTLQVSDAHGSSSTTDFMVEVVDSKIDSIQLPPDRWFQVAGRAGTFVDIGTASASDICSGSVDITNDAPSSLLFPPG